MKIVMLACLALATTGCAIERVGPPGVTLTRAIPVKPGNVLVFESADAVKARFSVVEDIFVADDGETSPKELESRLRVMAGARGANAIILDPLNRRDNGTRVLLEVRFDDPFEYYSAEAIWIGDTPRPEKVLRGPKARGG